MEMGRGTKSLDGVLPFLSLEDTHREDLASHDILKPLQYGFKLRTTTKGDNSIVVLLSGQRLRL